MIFNKEFLLQIPNMDDGIWNVTVKEPKFGLRKCHYWCKLRRDMHLGLSGAVVVNHHQSKVDEANA